MLERSSPVDEAVPSATPFGRHVRYWGSVQVAIAIVCMLGDEAAFRPSDQRAFADVEF